jgi:hypothetical protein
MAESVLIHTLDPMPLQWPDLTGAAERVFDRALKVCATKMGLRDAHAAAAQVRQGNVTARIHCCAGIARQIAEALGSEERNIRAIYAPDDDVPLEALCEGEGTQHRSSVDLFVWTRHKTAKLDALVAAWDRALVKACQSMIGSQGQTSLLSVYVMDDAHIEQHFGAGQNGRLGTRLAVYWLQTVNQAVDIVYSQNGA